MKLILCGACGKMGRMMTELAETQRAEIVCGVDRIPRPSPYPVYASPAQIREEADAVVDFSSREGLEERLLYAAEHGLPILLGETGFTEEDEEIIRRFAERIPIFKTGNLSLGINLLQLLVKKAAALLEDFDVEIVERHHNQKKDAPSGTALMLAESVRSASEGRSENVYGRHGMVGARRREEIGIHAIRGGTIVGEHEVMFAGDDEILTLSHSARSRKVFANGAYRAVRWLLLQPNGLYDMNDLLGEVLPEASDR